VEKLKTETSAITKGGEKKKRKAVPGKEKGIYKKHWAHQGIQPRTRRTRTGGRGTWTDRILAYEKTKTGGKRPLAERVMTTNHLCSQYVTRWGMVGQCCRDQKIYTKEFPAQGYKRKGRVQKGRMAPINGLFWWPPVPDETNTKSHEGDQTAGVEKKRKEKKTEMNFGVGGGGPVTTHQKGRPTEGKNSVWCRTRSGDKGKGEGGVNQKFKKGQTRRQTD